MKNNHKIFDKRALTILEAAQYSCVSRGMVENWLNGGLLPFEELPSKGKGLYCFRRIRKSDLDNFLNKYYRQYPQFEKTKNLIELNELSVYHKKVEK